MPFREVSRMDARLEFVMLASVEGADIGSCAAALASARRLAISGWSAGDGREHGAFGAVASAAQFTGAQRCSHGASSAFGTWRTSSLGWPQDRQAAEGSRAGRSSGALTVTAILKRNGVELGAQGGGQPAFARFERTQPNELWQMDYKGHVALHTGRFIR